MTEARLPASQCRNMGEIRAGVDALDWALVALVLERQRYMEQAARIKQTRDAVRDEARIADVVGKVLAEAQCQGLSEKIAEPVWRTLIECCIAHEMAAFDAQQRKAAGGKSAG